nr:MAG TPA: deoxyribosyltransferase [Caudoviricetes sp.]
MKKLFISCPMKNRTKENIQMTFERLHKIAEAVFNESLEVIPTYIEDNPPSCRTEGLWFLGKSIELLAQADYFIGICGDNAFQYNGCTVEIDAAKLYGVTVYLVPTVFAAPDVAKTELVYNGAGELIN